MAGKRVTSGTLVASTAQTLTFVAYYSGLQVVNTGSTAIYARTDGTAATVAGDDNDVILPTSAAVIYNRGHADDQGAGSAPGTSISLISSGTPTFTVAGSN
jgi:hypothetical protein